VGYGAGRGDDDWEDFTWFALPRLVLEDREMNLLGDRMRLGRYLRENRGFGVVVYIVGIRKLHSSPVADWDRHHQTIASLKMGGQN